MKSFTHKVKFVPICLIAVYQEIISPLISPTCRFYPSCSTYARQAIEKYGVWRGSAMSLTRLCKCHPFHPGGYDPLP